MHQDIMTALRVIFLVLIASECAKGQICSTLDTAVKKTWQEGQNTDIEFSDTTMVVTVGIIAASAQLHVQSRFLPKTYQCVAENNGFRLYRRDYSLSFGEYTEYVCIKVLDSSQEGFLQIARIEPSDVIRTEATDDICTFCKLTVDASPVVSLVEDGSGLEPLPKIDIDCNMPETCIPDEPFQIPCTSTPEVSELEVFCGKLLEILSSKSSEEVDESDNNEDNEEEIDTGIPVVAVRGQIWRRKGKKDKQKSGGKSKNVNTDSREKGKKKGHCNKRLVDEILATCAFGMPNEGKREMYVEHHEVESKIIRKRGMRKQHLSKKLF